MEVFGRKTDLGAGVSRKLTMVFFLEGRLGVNEGSEISMASLRGNFACVHAEVHTHDGVETESGVGNLCEGVGNNVGGGEIGALGRY